MDLDNFREQTKIEINAAFNFASESRFVYFTPLHLLLTLVKNDSSIKKTLSYFKIDMRKILEQCIKIANKDKTYSTKSSSTQVQANLILLLQEVNKKIKNDAIILICLIIILSSLS
jgi:ATP-dependent Clp protease ATP-binding subunit ClpA